MFDIRENSKFSLKRKPLASSYSSIQSARNYFQRNRNNTTSSVDIASFTEGSQLDTYFRNPGQNNEKCIVLSNTLYDTNRVYAQLLEYLSNMYYWRYTVTPRKVGNSDKKITKEQYYKNYTSMLEYVEGISIETVFPTLLLNIFKNGKVNFTVSFNKASKTISTIILPDKYCKPTFLTQYGTQEIMFDFKFFDDLGLQKNQIAELLNTFPEEFTELYYQYKEQGTGDRWKILNAKHSTCISMNEESFPTFLSIFYDLIDYKTYKLNELDRSLNMLERIVVQEVDMESTGLDMEEIGELHDSLVGVICQNKGSMLVTTPGKIAVEQLQEDIGQENKTLTNSYKSIYDNAGFNNALFTGENDSALKASTDRDLAYVWKYVQKLESFYNLAINNGKSFGGYQISLKILPISPYNEEEKLGTYHQAATLGVGVMDYIVATGTKQVDLEATIELGEFLDLSHRLVPLQSSHTQSAMGAADGDDGKKDAEKDADNPTEVTDPSKEDANTDEEIEDSNKTEEKE